MTKKSNSAYDALEKIFHEPNRLSIMSAVCAADKGVVFTDLRELCGLTDGNLNRHLKVLEEANAVKIEKTFVSSKPRTTIRITKLGLSRFSDYLGALNGILSEAQKALPSKTKGRTSIVIGKRVKA